MKKTFSLAIPAPCHEKWEEFTPADKGRFCGSCQKVVIDFTAMGDEEIKNYFLEKKETVCGRLNTSQLKIYVHTPPKQYRWKLAAMFAFFLLWFIRQSVAQTMGKPVMQEQVDEPKKISSQTTTVYVSLTVMGTVRDSTFKAPIHGVIIRRKGYTEQTVTDAEGKFQLIMPGVKPEEHLEVLVRGFKTQVITVKPGNPIVDIYLNRETPIACQTLVLGGAIAMTHHSLWWKVKHVFRK